MYSSRFTAEHISLYCERLADMDIHFRHLLDEYGYPPFWSREPSFDTLIHIILEQQVSLASARAAFLKLKSYIGNITPEKLLTLSDEELRNCYFSRQKAHYARCLARAIAEQSIDIALLIQQPDDQIREQLTAIKGIGNWTVDVFLMMCLHSTDIFPLGDIALVNSLKHVKQLPSDITREEMVLITQAWKPYRTIAAFMLWHAYICRKKIVFEPIVYK